MGAADPDYFAFRLFAEALGGGMSSRLFQEARERLGLAYAIDAFAETYQDKAHPDPAYGENFAVGDVPPGRYLVAALVAGKPVWRTVDVRPGLVSWIEFRAPATTP